MSPGATAAVMKPEVNQILFPCRWLASASVDGLRVLFSFEWFPHGFATATLLPQIVSQKQLFDKAEVFIKLMQRPVVKTPCFQSRGRGFDLWLGSWWVVRPQNQNKLKKKKTNKKPYSRKRSSLWEDLSNVSEGENLGEIFTGFVLGGGGVRAHVI